MSGSESFPLCSPRASDSSTMLMPAPMMIALGRVEVLGHMVSDRSRRHPTRPGQLIGAHPMQRHPGATQALTEIASDFAAKTHRFLR